MTGFLVVALVITALAAVTDWRTGNIPNWLTLGSLAVAPIAHIIHAKTSLGMVGSEAALEGCYSLVGAAFCGIVPAVLYRRDAIGAGDVKLLLAVGAWLTSPGALQLRMMGFEAEMYAFFAAGIFAPARLAYEGKLFATLRNTLAVAANPFLPKAKQRKIEPAMLTWFRFGPSIFVGTLVTAILHWRP